MIQAIRICFFLFTVGALTTGCLQTRSTAKDQEEKQVLQRQVHTLQTTTAEVSQRFTEIDEDLRKLNGRIETVESRTQQMATRNEQSGQGQDLKTKELEERLKLYQQAITKLDMQVSELTAQMATLQHQVRSNPQGSSSGGGAKETPLSALEEANKLFDSKKWQEAALAYERYRKIAPKGKSIPTATYKIGVCFQELGSNEDARAFYEEVIAKFPKSADAKKAKTRLAGLKK